MRIALELVAQNVRGMRKALWLTARKGGETVGVDAHGGIQEYRFFVFYLVEHHPCVPLSVPSI